MRAHKFMAHISRLSLKQAILWFLVVGDASASIIKTLAHEFLFLPNLTLLALYCAYLIVVIIVLHRKMGECKELHPLLLVYFSSWIPNLYFFGFVTPIGLLTRLMLKYAGI
jgi:hypothetical protein